MEFSFFPRHYVVQDFPSCDVLFIGEVAAPTIEFPIMMLKATYTDGSIGIQMHSKEDGRPIGGIFESSYYPQLYEFKEAYPRNGKTVDDFVEAGFKRTDGKADIIEVRDVPIAMSLEDGERIVTAEFSNALVAYGRAIYDRISNAGTHEDIDLFKLKKDANKHLLDPAEGTRAKENLLKHALTTATRY